MWEFALRRGYGFLSLVEYSVSGIRALLVFIDNAGLFRSFETASLDVFSLLGKKAEARSGDR